MSHLIKQEIMVNTTIIIPKSDEINWDLYIVNPLYRDEIKYTFELVEKENIWKELSELNLTDSIELIKSKLELQDKKISDYSIKFISDISVNGIPEKYIDFYEEDFCSELFISEDMVKVSFITSGLIAFFGKIIYDYLKN
jgi:hypothetical protein